MSQSNHPIPGKLYQLVGKGGLFVPVVRNDNDTLYEVAWHCITPDGMTTLWLWEGCYDLVEECKSLSAEIQ